jgi:hypothetical protein
MESEYLLPCPARHDLCHERDEQSITASYFTRIRFDIILPCTSTSLPFTFLYQYPRSPMCATCLFNLILLDMNGLVKFGEMFILSRVRVSVTRNCGFRLRRSCFIGRLVYNYTSNHYNHSDINSSRRCDLTGPSVFGSLSSHAGWLAWASWTRTLSDPDCRNLPW